MATKWGILSAGKICHDFTICLRSLDPTEHQIVAVAARSLDDAKQFAKTHGIAKAYGSYIELAQDPDVQVVYIGTLVSHHLTTGKLMLNHGKHVLMEKSFTLTGHGAQELVDLARSKKLFLMEAIWSRFNPAYKFVMDKLANKAIGDVTYVNATFGLDLHDVERLTKKSHGGGTVLDLGVYTLNIISMVYDNEEPEEIKATGHVNEDGVDESIALTLKYSNKRIATMANTLKALMPNEAHIVGTKGTIKLPSPFWCADTVVMIDAANPGKEEVLKFPPPPTNVKEPFNFWNSSFLIYEAMHVRECLTKGLTESPILPLKDTLLIRRISDEILKQVGVKFEE